MGDAKRRKASGDMPYQQRVVTEGAQDMRALAAGIDQRAAQLLADHPNFSDNALMEYMVPFLPALHRIWTTVSTDTLYQLCREFPHFYRYAVVMEDAFEKQRKDPTAFGVPADLQTLQDSVRIPFLRLTNEGATLERELHALLQGFQELAALDPTEGAAKRKAAMVRGRQVQALHEKWLHSIDAFGVTLKAANLNQVTNDMVKQFIQQVLARCVALIDRYQATVEGGAKQ